MKAATFCVAVLVCLLSFDAPAQAQPLSLFLQPTSPLFNQDPPGAPLPLGRRQYYSGNVLLNGAKIGEFLSIRDVYNSSFNSAALTLTLFFGNGTILPNVITLQGVETFSGPGGARGSVSASDFVGVVGVRFTVNAGTLTLLFPGPTGASTENGLPTTNPQAPLLSPLLFGVLSPGDAIRTRDTSTKRGGR